MTTNVHICILFARLTMIVALVPGERCEAQPVVDVNLFQVTGVKAEKVDVDVTAEVYQNVDMEVGPDRSGARAKISEHLTLEAAPAALTPTSYYAGPAGGTSADCEAAITSKAECQSASNNLGKSFYTASWTSHQSGCLTKSGNVLWNPVSDRGQASRWYQPVCKHVSTPSPTAAPVAIPVTAANAIPVTAANTAAGSTVAAVGDPHMQNILGQRFDLAQPGKHTLLQVPRGVSDSDALLRVMADARHEGGACSDMYFKALNITGLWVSAHQKDGYMYTAGAPEPVASWRTLGKVEVKVAWGRTLGGVEYLNFMVRHLTRVGHDIGGLLGMDDHTQAVKRDPLCGSAVLVQLHSTSQETSFAMADM